MQGAPEGILDRCSYVRVGKDRRPMSEDLRVKILETISKYGTGSFITKNCANKDPKSIGTLKIICACC